MSTSLAHLLPAVDQAVRCADHARSITVDPGGTGIRADRVVVVATPGEWPKPALDHKLLIDPAAVLHASPTPTRLLAGHPDTDGEGTVTVFDRVGAGAIEYEYAFPPDQPAELTRLANLVAATAPGDDDPASDFLVARYDPARPTLLVCAQGTHDVCCGADGTRLALAVEEAAPRLGDVRVVRVSHTGGHRFAPTGMTFPDGRMWAGLDLADVETLLSSGGELGGLVARCRGWWGADKGHAQVAERAVLAVVGRELDQMDRTVTTEPAVDDGIALAVRRCTVTAGERSWAVEVGIGREVPTIACRQPGGLPAKTGLEYEVVSLAES